MKNENFKYILYLLFIFLFVISLLIFSSASSEAVREGLHLCARSVIPSLFPFFVASNLIINLKIADRISSLFNKIMSPLFSLSGSSSAALLLGFISGYPIGASTCAALYSSGSISRREAERLLAFCNNSGPAFILGAIGTGVFCSVKIGVILLIIHILATLLVGFILRIFSPVNITETKATKKSHIPSFSFAFTDSVTAALMSSLKISAYIVFFAVVTALINKMNILSIFRLPHGIKAITEAFVCGILEITSGTYKIYDAVSPSTAFILTSAFLGFGGLSVHCQTLSCLSGTDIKTREYFLGKLLHGIISGFFAFIVSRSKLFERIEVFSDFDKSFRFNNAVVLVVPVLICLFYIFFKKSWKKT